MAALCSAYAFVLCLDDRRSTVPCQRNQRRPRLSLVEHRIVLSPCLAFYLHDMVFCDPQFRRSKSARHVPDEMTAAYSAFIVTVPEIHVTSSTSSCLLLAWHLPVMNTILYGSFASMLHLAVSPSVQGEGGRGAGALAQETHNWAGSMHFASLCPSHPRNPNLCRKRSKTQPTT